LVNEVRYGGNPKKISLHRVTLLDALDQGFLYKLQLALPVGVDPSFAYKRRCKTSSRLPIRTWPSLLAKLACARTEHAEGYCP